VVVGRDFREAAFVADFDNLGRLVVDSGEAVDLVERMMRYY
jgi:hypothetical protein